MKVAQEKSIFKGTRYHKVKKSFDGPFIEMLSKWISNDFWQQSKIKNIKACQ